MKFVLEVDLAAGVVPDDVNGELGRILRYWAGNVKHYPLEPGAGEMISDSAYSTVGWWRFVDE
ncbi:MAG: hypothetical protein J7523_16030 [Cellulomonas sp.]|nr:hypothetical protein [Cellulomonas sp.]